ncbi:MAG: thioredoxin-dependent thiol peroxidase [Chloroflexi bacterium]|nr:thioredoxin-dependent thiol peroxidase [Chloroflexota bacterium]
MTLSIGDKAPQFTLPDEKGVMHSLFDYLGKPLVIFFYPEDDTPGCTQEACNFRDDYTQYKDAGVELLGISPDDSDSHEAFKSKYDLPFTLLADEGHKICEEYGVWGEKKLFGIPYIGLHRTTFLIDAEGKVSKVFNVNRIGQQGEDVLETLDQMRAK